jgi:hypothetical protein
MKKKKKKQSYTYLITDGKEYRLGSSIHPYERVKEMKESNPSIKLVTFGVGVSKYYLLKKLVNGGNQLKWFKMDKEELHDIVKLINKGESKTNPKREYKSKVDTLLKEHKLNSNFEIPFGKNKGRVMKDLNGTADYKYAKWFINNASNKRERSYKAFNWFIKKHDKELENQFQYTLLNEEAFLS